MLQMIVQLLISGIALGFIYALVGIEYTLIWNSTGLLNFSHDKIITLGAYIFGGTLIMKMGANNIVAAIITMIVMGIIGAIIAAGIFNPLRSMPSTIFAIMGTIILGRILSEATRLIWGPVPFTIPGWLSGYVEFGSFTIPKANILISIIALIVVAALQLFLITTRIGKAMRCVAQNKKAASLMGINVSQNICITTGISSMICCIIGLLIVPLFNIDTTMAATIGLKGFSAGVIGGFGYLPGAIVGGLFIGIMENLSVLYLPAVYKDVVSFVLLITFLLLKPSGILGKRL